VDLYPNNLKMRVSAFLRELNSRRTDAGMAITLSNQFNTEVSSLRSAVPVGLNPFYTALNAFDLVH
jgi:hypothetical protein